MTDQLDDVRALLPDLRLTHLDTLGGSDRSTVWRVGTDSENLIVKSFPGAGEGWVRESAALSVMPPDAPTPRLVAAGGTPPIVVMSDLGSGPSVADALLGDDPAVAVEAVLSWAAALAALHDATAGAREAFQAALDLRCGDLPVAASAVTTELDTAAEVIARHCAELDVHIPAGALDELRGLAARLGEDGPAALTPSDACPDNNVRVDGRLVLIDFEGAQWRHIAWDLAYLLVPWPSCWCSWRIPAELSEQAIGRYRAARATPYLDTPAFRDDLAAATVGWAFISVSWFLHHALADSPPSRPEMPVPDRRALTQHRLHAAHRAGQPPALAELAGRLHEALAGRWGEVPLRYAPAFGG